MTFVKQSNDNLKEKLVSTYSDSTQKFLFWLDGVQSFAPKPISNLCDFIHASVEHDPNPVEVLLILGSILNKLENNADTINRLESIIQHIEILYPDNELNVKIEDLEILQTVRTGLKHWISAVKNPILGDKKFIDPPAISEVISGKKN